MLNTTKLIQIIVGATRNSNWKPQTQSSKNTDECN